MGYWRWAIGEGKLMPIAHYPEPIAFHAPSLLSFSHAKERLNDQKTNIKQSMQYLNYKSQIQNLKQSEEMTK